MNNYIFEESIRVNAARLCSELFICYDFIDNEKGIILKDMNSPAKVLFNFNELNVLDDNNFKIELAAIFSKFFRKIELTKNIKLAA